MKLNKLSTEQRNKQTEQLDAMSIHDILRAMNEEDKTVPEAVKEVIPSIEQLVLKTIEQIKAGGRMIYLGAGTSGRLGVLDAAECPPTFGVDSSLVVGIIAGGEEALLEAVEGAEDSETLAAKDLDAIDLSDKDVVIGIAASGRTPYVKAGLVYASSKGAATASISCNTNAEISQKAGIPIEIQTGPEILTGSTRLKAGTAQKLVLNMISTSVMIGLGKVYQNLMVDVKATNRKLEHRAKNMIVQATGVDEETAAAFYGKSHQNVKTAIVMILAEVTVEEAARRLKEAEGFVRKAIKLS
ncbi:N-acetylmuramic acid 6-phosphate etherase [Jeotgalibacillus campisalis]|uniref:N-acetylmuramic acid 6-phosphate etherase n=1 Tax=Jeotgalibacillus campisalis TaxID=220754 RepID=A0A0C2SFZ8_9BACL|nr:N-acetylmuramic acid 6-phosphate etherase [Jeotgalibacillus campisalis]KIL52859.1 N-acetylmuramic acid-6-phosphate etherase [Jeotgalibacillus campisalis]